MTKPLLHVNLLLDHTILAYPPKAEERNMTLPLILGTLIGFIVLGLIGFVLGRKLDDGYYQYHLNTIFLPSVFGPLGGCLGLSVALIITKA